MSAITVCNQKLIPLCTQMPALPGSTAGNAFVVPIVTGSPNDPEGPIFQFIAGNTYWATWSIPSQSQGVYFCVCGPGMTSQPLDTSLFTMYTGDPPNLTALDSTNSGVFVGQDPSEFSGQEYWVYTPNLSAYSPGDYYIQFKPTLSGSFGLNIVIE